MTKGKLIIIGGDAAGMTAASKLSREQAECETTNNYLEWISVLNS